MDGCATSQEGCTGKEPFLLLRDEIDKRMLLKAAIADFMATSGSDVLTQH